LRRLGPARGELLWNILLYANFIMALIALTIMPDKNLRSTLLVDGRAAVLPSSSSSACRWGRARRRSSGKRDSGMLAPNAIMLAFPLLAAGLVRTRQTHLNALSSARSWAA
jgi:hypothetical protein